jgi:hypothetical protein
LRESLTACSRNCASLNAVSHSFSASSSKTLAFSWYLAAIEDIDDFLRVAVLYRWYASKKSDGQRHWWDAL